jgi:hypothetical protein
VVLEEEGDAPVIAVRSRTVPLPNLLLVNAGIMKQTEVVIPLVAVLVEPPRVEPEPRCDGGEDLEVQEMAFLEEGRGSGFE